MTLPSDDPAAHRVTVCRLPWVPPFCPPGGAHSEAGPVNSLPDVQVPVCPLCNKPIPVKRGEPPDIQVSQHIDSDCQSDPAKEKRRVFSNKCSLKGCKQKELVPVLCSSCQRNFCLRHRHTADHDCKGFQGSGRIISKQGSAAINRASSHGATGGSAEPQKATSDKNLDRGRGERFVGSHASQMHQHGTTQPSTVFQAALSEDEAMTRAIHMSLTEQQPGKSSPDLHVHQDQEAMDLALARALQESEREEQQRRRQEQQRAGQQQTSDASRCHVA
ncbi:AN1-type zinc finger protein 2B-like [Acanthaster planci]|uniref:AN1-type zinc finger protein 2B-like n=1 Tax=Acanthaster planci TaxID=133434 RepID=A0A8B8A0Q3_ACAPL|nr:AN1-type zinc finger protein 2B-like [Acanthaster planci]